jgi:hypothetical protein
MASMTPFLSIWTPTYRRPTYLKRCMESVQAQTARDEIQHLVWEDRIGVGVAGMYAEIARHVDELAGRYVYILQDDDILTAESVVERLKLFAWENDEPPVIICRSVKGPLRLPTYWKKAPQYGHIDLGNYVVRRDVFAAHVNDFGLEYAGDYPFIRKLWDEGYLFGWCDMLLAQAQAWGLGRAEEDLVYTGVEFAVNERGRYSPQRAQRAQRKNNE